MGVEALRDALPTLRDQVLVSVLAYAGTRPEDALALEVRHLGRATLLVEQKNVDGAIVTGQKVDRPPRTIDLLVPRRQDLTEYLLATGRRAPKALLFPRPDGKPWRDTDYRNWRRRVFYPAAAARGLATLEQKARYVTVVGKDLRPSSVRGLSYRSESSRSRLAARVRLDDARARASDRRPGR